ncbi:MAG TPA: alpha/beta fold hydrolase [Acidimicrobiia bacterium]|nr:alpha/beta fold hydrolase [Acidimicrobiia bacterium]
MSERFTITTDDGVTLVGHRAGDGPGLLLVHGFGGAKEDFADHLDALARTHTVATFDHRGHGESGKPDDLGAYSFDRLRTDALAVADACGFGRFRLLGHSMGGMVVRRLAIDAPDRIEALVLMDTCPGPIPGFDTELLEFAALTAINDGKDTLKELLDAAAVLDSPAYQRVLVNRPGYQEFQDAKWAALSPIMWAAMVRAIGYQPDDLDALRSVECPTLVLVGEQDTTLVGPSRAMAEAIPGARLVVIADAGHSPQFEAPDAWFAALDGFLASLPAELSTR